MAACSASSGCGGVCLWEQNRSSPTIEVGIDHWSQLQGSFLRQDIHAGFVGCIDHRLHTGYIFSLNPHVPGIVRTFAFISHTKAFQQKGPRLPVQTGMSRHQQFPALRNIPVQLLCRFPGQIHIIRQDQQIIRIHPVPAACTAGIPDCSNTASARSNTDV